MISDWTVDTGTGNTSAPVVSSATYNFVAGDVGHWFFVQSGTNWYANCWYPIASVASNKATLSAAIGDGVCVDTTKGPPSPQWVASTVAGVASTGTPTGGVGTVDYSQATTSGANGTDLVSTNATTNPCTVTSASAPFSRNEVGNTIRISAGTSWTTGYYEIISVSGSTATLDRACGSSASITGGTWRMGGAFQFGNSLDDLFTEQFSATNGTGAGRIFIRAGTHTANGSITTAAAGGTQAPIIVEGYQSKRGDSPTGDNRPLISISTNIWTYGAQWHRYNLRVTGTGTSTVALGTNNVSINCFDANTSTAVGRIALTTSVESLVLNSEMVSIRGLGVQLPNSLSVRLQGNYIHSSNIAMTQGTNNAVFVINNLIEDIATTVLNASALQSTAGVFSGNTIVGGVTPRGTGISFITGTTDPFIIGNIIYGFVTGITVPGTQYSFFTNYNNFFNNTTNRTNVLTGPNDQTLDPQFVNVAEVTGTSATSATSVLTAASARDLSAVVPGRDYLYISSATGAAVGHYQITAVNDGADTVTLSPSPGTGSNITWSIITGRNYAIGTNLKGLGFPGAFPGGYTTAYTDIGGVQRQEAGSGGGTRIY
jgi:hypothetical protein